jgi:succinate-semialdehyde dehydrogenase / glutarate-semialdehyde dehydrogenase
VGIASINPATGQLVAQFDPHDATEVERRLALAADAAAQWRRTPLEQRLAVVARAGQLLERDADRLARLATLEMGKTIGSARDEVLKCAACCRYYADHAAAMLADEPVTVEGESVHVARDPLGVVLAVMPWNFPYWQVVRFAAPAICAGNVALLKHASSVPQCALALEALLTEAGAPDGVFQVLLVGGDAVASLVADPRVAAVTLTGSEGAGASVGAAAGAHLKKSVLELGGSDPFIVLPSAHLATAVETAVRARLVNTGQSCIAAKRFIVADAVYDAFARDFVAAMAALKAGDPLDPAVQVGPLASTGLRDELHAQVTASVSAGARLLLGGVVPAGAGAFYPPTVLEDPAHGTPAHDDELFGPVAVLFRARDAAHAVQIANASRFGLGASVWTADDDEARWMARELDAGTVVVNGMVASDPRLPFGGVKASGYGRELSAAGMLEFMNLKTVRLKPSAG